MSKERNEGRTSRSTIPYRSGVGLLTGLAVVTVVGISIVALPSVAGAQEAPPTPKVGGQVGGGGGEGSGGGKGGRTGSPTSTPSAPTTAAPTRAPDVEPASTSSGPPWPLLVSLGGLFGVLIGLGMGIVIGRASKRASSAPAPSMPAPIPTPMAPAPASSPQAERDRGRLVTALVDVRDQIDSPAMREWLRAALADVGVAEVVADGQPFDPQRHQAVDQVVATEPTWNNVVARTDRPGYTDRGAVMRLPQVSVYRYGA